MSFLLRTIRLAFIIYLTVFFTGCAPRQVSIEEARQIQTHIISVGMQTTMDAVITALQDQLYIIDNVNSDLNIIVASRATNKKLADTVVEYDVDDTPLWVKITGVALVTALIGFLIYTIFGKDGDEDDCHSNNDCYHEHSHNHYHFNSPSNDYPRTRSYNYKLNVNLSENDNGGTKVRIIAQGEYLEDGNVVRAGAIQDPKFYNRIFRNIDNIVFDL